jgi:prophage maintenance system killer protein
VITLDAADLVLIAGRIFGIGTDDALDQLDVAAAQAALAEARVAGSAIIDQDTAAAAAIGLMHALLRHRPYARQSERIAVAAGLQFLSLNQWSAVLDPPAAVVVVEALACGQLSPADAAAWLSPRLAASPGRIAGTPASITHRRAAMSDTSPSPRKPVQPAARRQPKPPSVRYPQILLFVQAGFWAVAAAVGLSIYAVALVHNGTSPRASILFAWPAIVSGLAIAKVMLALRLDRSPSKRVWWAIIATELAMTVFGVLWLAVPAYGVVMLGFFGACLSLAAVVCMTRPRARQYFAAPAVAAGPPDPDASRGPARFWALALPGQQLALA